MSATEIILIAIGIVFFLLGYLMPARKKDMDEEVQLISEDEVRKMVSSEVEHVKDRIEDIVDETVNYSIEKAERAMERVTNEKIMAVNEYSDTVLEEINKNHKEVVFLYDMLNDKHDNLVTTVNEASALADEIKQTARDAELTAAEAADRIDAVMQAADDAADILRDAENAAAQAQNVMRSAARSAGGQTSGTVRREETPEAGQELSAGEAEEAQSAVMVEESEPVLVQPADIIGGGELTAAEGEEDIPRESTPDAGDTDAPEQPDFSPIRPRRVEIIHQPDADYAVDEVQEDMSTSEAFASMGFFAQHGEAPAAPGRKGRTRRRAGKERAQEGAAQVDIQFAQEDGNGRNSNDRILELHKAGKSNMAIARELGLGLGEVKLVIDLFEGM